MNRGQSGIEMITLLGLIMLFSIPLIALIGSLNDNDLAVKQAQSCVQIMTDTANSVFIMGCNSSSQILVPYPGKLRNVSINGREIIFTLDKGTGMVDVSGVSIAPLDNSSVLANETIGRWVSAGARKMLVYCNDDGKIRFDIID